MSKGKNFKFLIPGQKAPAPPPAGPRGVPFEVDDQKREQQLGEKRAEQEKGQGEETKSERQ